MNLQESIRRILREETEGYKLNLVKKIIYTLYDNISFIKQSTFNGKPLLIIYFDSDDTAANIESWFDEKISRDIDEWSSGNIVVCPSWVANWDSRKKNADVYINTELIKYDNLGNVVNESVLREELLPRVRRRIDPDEMEKEFLESFDYAYDLTKRRKVLSTHFLDELIYSTVTIMMDGFHWRFVSTLPEDEFWYDDIHTGLQNHYKDRIIQMYNERQGINESILREEKETEFSTPFKRRLGRFTSFVWDNNVINYPCDFENFDSFIHGIHAEVMDMVSDGSDTDGPLSDWLTYIDAIRYIQRYMSDDLKEYYNRECVNKTLKEATESDDKKDSKAPIVDVILMGGLDYRKGDLNIG